MFNIITLHHLLLVFYLLKIHEAYPFWIFSFEGFENNTFSLSYAKVRRKMRKHDYDKALNCIHSDIIAKLA